MNCNFSFSVTSCHSDGLHQQNKCVPRLIVLIISVSWTASNLHAQVLPPAHNTHSKTFGLLASVPGQQQSRSRFHSLSFGPITWVSTCLNKNWGVNVIAYEYEGYGIHTGSPSASGANRDIRVVYDFLKNELEVPSRNIVVFGVYWCGIILYCYSSFRHWSFCLSCRLS
jgi:hypothetical protein